MRVICVKWGNKYGWEWVQRLRRMVQRHLNRDHEFVVMTDDREGAIVNDYLWVDCAPDLPTWWSKVGLFRPGLFPGLNLYLDLDVVITGDITGMVEENEPGGMLIAPDDFSYSLANPRQGLARDTRRQLGGVGTVNSSVMLWRDDDGFDVWHRFDPEKMNVLHGDQNWITQCLWPNQLWLLTSGWVCSYKYHVQRGEPTLPIVVFHGEPKVTALPREHPLRVAWTA